MGNQYWHYLILIQCNYRGCTRTKNKTTNKKQQTNRSTGTVVERHDRVNNNVHVHEVLSKRDTNSLQQKAKCVTISTPPPHFKFGQLVPLGPAAWPCAHTLMVSTPGGYQLQMENWKQDRRPMAHQRWTPFAPLLDYSSHLVNTPPPPAHTQTSQILSYLTSLWNLY